MVQIPLHKSTVGKEKDPFHVPREVLRGSFGRGAAVRWLGVVLPESSDHTSSGAILVSSHVGLGRGGSIPGPSVPDPFIGRMEYISVGPPKVTSERTLAGPDVGIDDDRVLRRKE